MTTPPEQPRDDETIVYAITGEPNLATLISILADIIEAACVVKTETHG
jgi:hypothetical protein